MQIKPVLNAQSQQKRTIDLCEVSNVVSNINYLSGTANKREKLCSLPTKKMRTSCELKAFAYKISIRVKHYRNRALNWILA